MRRANRHRPGMIAVLATAAAGCLVTLSAVPADAVDAASSRAVQSDPTLVLAAAAASGAGSEASGVIGEGAERALVAVGGVAARVQGTLSTLSHALLHWQGWVSGAAGDEAEDGSFGSWRGKPLGIVAVWCDSSAAAMTSLDAVDNYATYRGQMDVAVGIFAQGETWQQAAAGAFVSRWTQAMRNLKAKRAGRGTTYVRIAHEMNGDWMPWGVPTTADVAAYKKAYRMYAGIVRKEFPEAKLTWSPNGGNHSTASIDQFYPGDDVVDVIGPDIYDGFPDVTSPEIWQENLYAMTGTSPKGLGAWQRHAARKGKPLALPEWGLPYGDHPEFIKGVHDFMAKHAAGRSGAVAGRFVYDVYFNAEEKFKIYNGPNAQAGSMYTSLRWGS